MRDTRDLARFQQYQWPVVGEPPVPAGPPATARCFPLPPQSRPEPQLNPASEVNYHFRRFAEAEIAAPIPHSETDNRSMGEDVTFRRKMTVSGVEALRASANTSCREDSCASDSSALSPTAAGPSSRRLPADYSVPKPNALELKKRARPSGQSLQLLGALGTLSTRLRPLIGPAPWAVLT